jgi:hypothetical protein
MTILVSLLQKLKKIEKKKYIHHAVVKVDKNVKSN